MVDETQTIVSSAYNDNIVAGQSVGSFVYSPFVKHLRRGPQVVGQVHEILQDLRNSQVIKTKPRGVKLTGLTLDQLGAFSNRAKLTRLSKTLSKWDSAAEIAQWVYFTTQDPDTDDDAVAAIRAMYSIDVMGWLTLYSIGDALASGNSLDESMMIGIETFFGSLGSELDLSGRKEKANKVEGEIPQACLWDADRYGVGPEVTKQECARYTYGSEDTSPNHRVPFAEFMDGQYCGSSWKTPLYALVGRKRGNVVAASFQDGGELGSEGGYAFDLEHCSQLCLHTKGCDHFTYDKAKQECRKAIRKPQDDLSRTTFKEVLKCGADKGERIGKNVRSTEECASLCHFMNQDNYTTSVRTRQCREECNKTDGCLFFTLDEDSLEDKFERCKKLAQDANKKYFGLKRDGDYWSGTGDGSIVGKHSGKEPTPSACVYGDEKDFHGWNKDDTIPAMELYVYSAEDEEEGENGGRPLTIAKAPWDWISNISGRVTDRDSSGKVIKATTVPFAPRHTCTLYSDPDVKISLNDYVENSEHPLGLSCLPPDGQTFHISAKSLWQCKRAAGAAGHRHMSWTPNTQGCKSSHFSPQSATGCPNDHHYVLKCDKRRQTVHSGMDRSKRWPHACITNAEPMQVTLPALDFDKGCDQFSHDSSTRDCFRHSDQTTAEECPLCQDGDALSSSEKELDPAGSMLACIDQVQEKEPSANAATFGGNSGDRCLAEFNATGEVSLASDSWNTCPIEPCHTPMSLEECSQKCREDNCPFFSLTAEGKCLTQKHSGLCPLQADNDRQLYATGGVGQTTFAECQKACNTPGAIWGEDCNRFAWSDYARCPENATEEQCTGKERFEDNSTYCSWDANNNACYRDFGKTPFAPDNDSYCYLYTGNACRPKYSLERIKGVDCLGYRDGLESTTVSEVECQQACLDASSCDLVSWKADASGSKGTCYMRAVTDAKPAPEENTGGGCGEQVWKRDPQPTTHDYKCPPNSYISSTRWPIVDFSDCTCNSGYMQCAETCEKVEDGCPVCKDFTESVTRAAEGFSCYTSPDSDVPSGTCPGDTLYWGTASERAGKSRGDVVDTADPMGKPAEKCAYDVQNEATPTCQTTTGCDHTCRTMYTIVEPATDLPEQPPFKHDTYKLLPTNTTDRTTFCKLRCELQNAKTPLDRCAQLCLEESCEYFSLKDSTCRLFWGGNTAQQDVSPATVNYGPACTGETVYKYNFSASPISSMSAKEKFDECKRAAEQTGASFFGLSCDSASCVEGQEISDSELQRPGFMGETCVLSRSALQTKPQHTTGWGFADVVVDIGKPIPDATCLKEGTFQTHPDTTLDQCQALCAAPCQWWQSAEAGETKCAEMVKEQYPDAKGASYSNYARVCYAELDMTGIKSAQKNPTDTSWRACEFKGEDRTCTFEDGIGDGEGERWRHSEMVILPLKCEGEGCPFYSYDAATSTCTVGGSDSTPDNTCAEGKVYRGPVGSGEYTQSFITYRRDAQDLLDVDQGDFSTRPTPRYLRESDVMRPLQGKFEIFANNACLDAGMEASIDINTDNMTCDAFLVNMQGSSFTDTCPGKKCTIEGQTCTQDTHADKTRGWCCSWDTDLKELRWKKGMCTGGNVCTIRTTRDYANACTYTNTANTGGPEMPITMYSKDGTQTTTDPTKIQRCFAEEDVVHYDLSHPADARTHAHRLCIQDCKTHASRSYACKLGISQGDKDDLTPQQWADLDEVCQRACSVTQGHFPPVLDTHNKSRNFSYASLPQPQSLPTNCGTLLDIKGGGSLRCADFKEPTNDRYSRPYYGYSQLNHRLQDYCSWPHLGWKDFQRSKLGGTDYWVKQMCP